jgi:hypothetical protein
VKLNHPEFREMAPLNLVESPRYVVRLALEHRGTRQNEVPVSQIVLVA